MKFLTRSPAQPKPFSKQSRLIVLISFIVLMQLLVLELLPRKTKAESSHPLTANLLQYSSCEKSVSKLNVSAWVAIPSTKFQLSQPPYPPPKTISTPLHVRVLVSSGSWCHPAPGHFRLLVSSGSRQHKRPAHAQAKAQTVPAAHDRSAQARLKQSQLPQGTLVLGQEEHDYHSRLVSGLINRC